MKRSIAVIPARGGSKRIPRKNILDFHGKPLIAWSIEAAKESGLFESILVSTDDPEIQTIARRFGAEVPFLRRAFSDDQSPTSLATIDSLKQYEEARGVRFDTVVQLMASCPLRGSADIVQSCASFATRDRKFQISSFRYGWMNPWWAHQVNDSGTPTSIFDSSPFSDATKKRSQDLPKLYCPTGAIWIATVADLMESGTFYGPGHAFEEIPWSSAVDIDDREDWEMAETIYATRKRTS